MLSLFHQLRTDFNSSHLFHYLCLELVYCDCAASLVKCVLYRCRVQALVDCLAAESKSVEAKLQVLTAALAYYTNLRPSHDAVAAEADALGHYLFMYVFLKYTFTFIICHVLVSTSPAMWNC